MLHPKMFAPCPNPSTIWAFLHVICLISLFFIVMCNYMCDMWYLICTMFSLICNVSRSMHENPSIYVTCLNPCMMCLKFHMRSFNLFKTREKIALSVSISVASSCYVVLANSYMHAQIFMWHRQIQLLTIW